MDPVSSAMEVAGIRAHRMTMHTGVGSTGGEGFGDFAFPEAQLILNRDRTRPPAGIRGGHKGIEFRRRGLIAVASFRSWVPPCGHEKAPVALGQPGRLLQGAIAVERAEV